MKNSRKVFWLYFLYAVAMLAGAFVTAGLVSVAFLIVSVMGFGLAGTMVLINNPRFQAWMLARYKRRHEAS